MPAPNTFSGSCGFVSVAWEDSKKDIKKESAGLSPAETKELEELKQGIVERKAILKEQGLSGGQQNKDEVVKMVARMNELKEKQDWVGLIMIDQIGSVYMVFYMSERRKQNETKKRVYAGCGPWFEPSDLVAIPSALLGSMTGVWMNIWWKYFREVWAALERERERGRERERIWLDFARQEITVLMLFFVRNIYIYLQ